MQAVTAQHSASLVLLTAALASLQVFGPDASQHKLYDQAISPIVEEVLDGFNCTIFAYGQTGTGEQAQLPHRLLSCQSIYSHLPVRNALNAICRFLITYPTSGSSY